MGQLVTSRRSNKNKERKRQTNAGAENDTETDDSHTTSSISTSITNKLNKIWHKKNDVTVAHSSLSVTAATAEQLQQSTFINNNGGCGLLSSLVHSSNSIHPQHVYSTTTIQRTIEDSYNSENKNNKNVHKRSPVIINTEMPNLTATAQMKKLYTQKTEDMEQLINMMKNHKVSENGTSTTTTTTTTSSSSNKDAASFTSPEFKFSFFVNIPPFNASNIYSESNNSCSSNSILSNHSNNNNNKEGIILSSKDSVKSNITVDTIREEESETAEEAKDNKEQMKSHILNRKILPLPKSRLKKDSSSISSGTSHSSIPLPPKMTTMTAATSTSPVIPTNNKKKMKWDVDNTQTTNNKRKERNWKDTNVTSDVTTVNNDKLATFLSPLQSSATTSSIMLIEKRITIKPIIAPPLANNNTSQQKKTPSATIKETTPVKKKQPAKQTPKKKQQQQQQQQQQQPQAEIAPGGFLSSDITLFENPISPDDYICLFCQYDILFNNNHHALAKKNKNKMKK